MRKAFLPALITALVATGLLFALPGASASLNIPPDSLHQVDAKTSLKVLRCYQGQWAEMCVVHYYENGQRVGNNEVEMWAEDILKQEKAYWATQGKAPPPVNGGQQAAAATCPAAPPAISSKAPPSKAVFQRKIYDNYALSANGTGSAPQRVGVTFEKFVVSAPIVNTVKVVPGQGAHRITDGAPANTALTPVSSVHVVCEQYRDGISQRRVESRYFCFKSKAGTWTCGGEGVPKITQLK